MSNHETEHNEPLSLPDTTDSMTKTQLYRNVQLQNNMFKLVII